MHINRGWVTLCKSSLIRPSAFGLTKFSNWSAQGLNLVSRGTQSRYPCWSAISIKLLRALPHAFLIQRIREVYNSNAGQNEISFSSWFSKN